MYSVELDKSADTWLIVAEAPCEQLSEPTETTGGGGYAGSGDGGGGRVGLGGGGGGDQGAGDGGGGDQSSWHMIFGKCFTTGLISKLM